MPATTNLAGDSLAAKGGPPWAPDGIWARDASESYSTACDVVYCGGEENTHVVTHECEVCPPGTVASILSAPATGADTDCDPIFCGNTEFGSNHACLPCPEYTAVATEEVLIARLEREDVTPSRKTELSLMMFTLYPHQLSPAQSETVMSRAKGTDGMWNTAAGADTECEPIVCKENSHVVSGECTPCSPGFLTAAGDVVSGTDTVCEPWMPPLFKSESVCVHGTTFRIMSKLKEHQKRAFEQKWKEKGRTFDTSLDYSAIWAHADVPRGRTSMVHSDVKVGDQLRIGRGANAELVTVVSKWGVFSGLKGTGRNQYCPHYGFRAIVVHPHLVNEHGSDLQFNRPKSDEAKNCDGMSDRMKPCYGDGAPIIQAKSEGVRTEATPVINAGTTKVLFVQQGRESWQRNGSCTGPTHFEASDRQCKERWSLATSRTIYNGKPLRVGNIVVFSADSKIYRESVQITAVDPNPVDGTTPSRGKSSAYATFRPPLRFDQPAGGLIQVGTYAADSAAGQGDFVPFLEDKDVPPYPLNTHVPRWSAGDDSLLEAGTSKLAIGRHLPLLIGSTLVIGDVLAEVSEEVQRPMVSARHEKDCVQFLGKHWCDEAKTDIQRFENDKIACKRPAQGSYQQYHDASTNLNTQEPSSLTIAGGAQWIQRMELL